MLINRITSVVAAIFIVFCLLVTIISGLSLEPRKLSNSKHLMQDNSSNESWFAVTSKSDIRQDLSDMTEAMSASKPTAYKQQNNNNNVLGAINSDQGLNINKNPNTEPEPHNWSNTIAATVDKSLHGQLTLNSIKRLHSPITSISSHHSSPNNTYPSHLFSSEDGVLSGTKSAENQSRLFVNFKSKAAEANSPKSLIQPSRFSHKFKRDTNQLDLLFEQLDPDSKLVLLNNRCLNKDVYLDSNGEFKIHHNQSTPFLLLKSQLGGMAIFSTKDKQFLCFDVSTGKPVSKKCFNWCLCSFNEKVDNNYISFELARNPKWKLSFKNNGEAISFNSSDYQDKRNKKCSNFLKVIYEGDDIAPMPNNVKHAENMPCDWIKSGEKIFEKEIQKYHTMQCNLFQQRFESSSNHNSGKSKSISSRELTSIKRTQRKKQILCSKSKRNVPKKVRHMTKKKKQFLCSKTR